MFHCGWRRTNWSIVTDANMNKIYLLEANVVGVLSEALTAHVQTVFADETVMVGACTAKHNKIEEKRKKNTFLN